MSVQDDKEITAAATTREGGPAPLSRRALIKSGAISMPAILTLQSGAALARSSNLISASSSDATDGYGRTLCLDTSSVYPAGDDPGIYDLGEPPHAVVNIIPERDYYADSGNTGGKKKKKKSKKKKGDAVPVSQGEMCESGGTYWWQAHSGSWEQVDLPYNGVVVSSGAMMSMADVVTDNLI